MDPRDARRMADQEQRLTELRTENDNLRVDIEQLENRLVEVANECNQAEAENARLKREVAELAAALNALQQWRDERAHFIDEWLNGDHSSTFHGLPDPSQARIEAEKNVMVILHETFGAIDPDAILREHDAALREQILTEGQNSICSYCGEKTLREGKSPEDFQAAIKDHMLTCEKRPEKQMLTVIWSMLACLNGAVPELPPEGGPDAIVALFEKELAAHDAALVAEKDAEIERLLVALNENYTDARGVVWTRPTAWAYAQACEALEKHHKAEAEKDAKISELAAMLERAPHAPECAYKQPFFAGAEPCNCWKQLALSGSPSVLPVLRDCRSSLFALSDPRIVCTCDEAYRGRNLRDPQCHYHQWSDEIEAARKCVSALDSLLGVRG